MPSPRSTGLSVTAFSRLRHDRRRRRERRTLAGDADEPDAVDEAARSIADREAAARRAWSAPRAAPSRHRRRRRPRTTAPSSSSGRSGRIAAPDAALARALREPLVPRVEHEVVVGHHHERDADVEVGELVETPHRRRAARERALATPPGSSGRPSPDRRTGCRSRSRRPRRRHGRARRRASPRRARRSRTGRAACGPRRAPRAGCASSGRRSQRRHPSRSITCATSLSPRPDRVTSTVRPRHSGAARSTHAIACAGSSAGTIPSVRGEQLERLEHLGVGDRHVARPGRRREVRVLGPDARIVEPGARSSAASSTWPSSSCMQVRTASPCTTPGTPWPDRRATGRLRADERRVACRRTRRRCPSRSSRRRRTRRRRRDRRRRGAPRTARAPRRR